ncbi:hypothetical protein SLAVM298S_01896 [Streptomyces lavendulae subsp. lavendulae]
MAAGHGAALEEHETVPHQVRVVRVVSDQDHPETCVAGGGDVLEDDAGLLDAEGGGGLVQDEDLGPEVHGAGDGHALALAAREGPDGLVDVAQVDAHAQQLGAGGLAHQLHVEAAEGSAAAGGLGAEEEVPPDRHQGDDGEVLVDGGDAAVEGRARVGELGLLPLDLEGAGVVPVQPRDDLDEGGLPCAVVAEHTGDPAGGDLQGDALEGADVAVVLADVGQLHQGGPGLGAGRGVRAHLLSSARLRTQAFSSVASRSMAPRKNLNQSGFHWAYTMPLLVMPKMKAPTAEPMAEP